MQDAVDIRFSKSELNSLVKTKATCVTLEKKTRVVFLLPSQLSDIKSGIKENLDSNLLKYDYETKAIIIGYEKIKILSKYGSICYGYSKIALRIEANLYLFKPAVGRILQGVVCKQSGHHLGCLVHKGFNVSIPLEDDDGYASGWDFSIGQDVKFTVVKLDLTSGPLPYIRGQLYVEGSECGTVVRRIESKVVGDDIIADVEEDEASEDGCVEVPVPQQVPDVPTMGSPCESKEVRTEWHEPEGGGVGSPPRESGGAEEGDGRNSLINQLLRTVEKSIAEGDMESPKKSKQKRVSLNPQSPGRKGPRTPSNALPLPAKVAEHFPEGVTPMTPPPSGGKGGQKRGVAKKGGSAGGEEGSDTGSIIDRLLEMSRRELLGVEGDVDTPRGKKRKVEEGPGEEGSKRKLLKKVDGGGVVRVAVKRESDLHPEQESTAKRQLSATDPSGGVKWDGTLLPSEKSVPSKTHRLSLPKMNREASVGSIDGSNLGLSPLLEPTKPSLPSRVKRKSMPSKLETYKLEK